MSETPIYRILLIKLFVSIINNTKENSKKFEKKIYFFKSDNKVNIKFIYYGFMSIKLNVIRYKGKLFQRNKKYRIKNKLCFYYGKSDY